MASFPLPDEPVSTALTEYEKQRLENVKRNQAMIAALGIENARHEIQLNVKKQDVKGYKRRSDKRVRDREEPVVTRRLRSSRVSWSTEDLHKLESPPPTPESKKQTLTLERSRKPVPLSSVCIRGSSPDSFASCLQDLEDKAPLSSSQKPNKAADWEIEPTQFSLHKDDIARVVPERIMSVAFLPIKDQLFVVAGDKGGHLGFWDVECQDTESDGVHVYQPHAAPVSGISVGSFCASKVYTCSYDGTIKQLDAETSMFDLKYCFEDDDVLSAICSVPGVPSCVYVGDGGGLLRRLDTREKIAASGIHIHHRRINTIDMSSQSPWQMVTSSTDATVCVWDVRKLKHDLDKIGNVTHQKAVQSAAFSPSGSSIATCSYDNTVAIVSTTFQKPPAYVAHPNMNNRWISTFRAIWGWDDEYIYVANMKRTIDIISRKFERELHRLSSPLMTSIPCRLAAHPLQQGVLAGCSAGGQIFVWRQ